MLKMMPKPKWYLEVLFHDLAVPICTKVIVFEHNTAYYGKIFNFSNKKVLITHIF